MHWPVNHQVRESAADRRRVLYATTSGPQCADNLGVIGVNACRTPHRRALSATWYTGAKPADPMQRIQTNDMRSRLPFAYNMLKAAYGLTSRQLRHFLGGCVAITSPP